jgi:2-hydroxy-3-keto-5-methylthiopentenyl-1-phosphate phosphatase
MSAMQSATGHTPPPIAAPLSQALVLLDYDGTVTTEDCVALTLQRFVGDAWLPMEEAARRGELSHADCLRQQLGMLKTPRREIIATMVAAAAARAGFARFVAALTAGGARVAIVSAGLREAIDAVWQRDALPAVDLYASELLGGAGSYDVAYSEYFGDCPSCGAGNCKAGVLRRLRRGGDAVFAFGDGVSDFCLAREADFVFARDGLAVLCAAAGIDYHELSTYDAALAAVLKLASASPPRRERPSEH